MTLYTVTKEYWNNGYPQPGWYSSNERLVIESNDVEIQRFVEQESLEFIENAIFAQEEIISFREELIAGEEIKLTGIRKLTAEEQKAIGMQEWVVTTAIDGHKNHIDTANKQLERIKSDPYKKDRDDNVPVNERFVFEKIKVSKLASTTEDGKEILMISNKTGDKADA